jgi:hypothetical protein
LQLAVTGSTIVGCQYGIYTNSINQFTVTQSSFTNNYYSAIYNYNPALSTVVASSAFSRAYYNPALYIYASQSYYNPPQNITVTNCTFADNQDGALNVYMATYYSYIPSTVIVANNTFLRNSGYTTALVNVNSASPASSFSNNVFVNNTYTYSSYSCVQLSLQQPFATMPVLGNTFNNNQGPASSAVFQLNKYNGMTANSTILYNTFTNNVGSAAIQLANGGTIASGSDASTIIQYNVMFNPMCSYELQALTTPSDVVNAQYCYWGVSNETFLTQRLYDSLNNPADVTVSYFPFLLSPSYADVVPLNVSRNTFYIDSNGLITGQLVDGAVVLTPAGSPYSVMSYDLIVGPAATLTIQPGVTIKFNTGISLRIQGFLIITCLIIFVIRIMKKINNGIRTNVVNKKCKDMC